MSLDPEFVDVHWCVDWRSGKGTPRAYSVHLCSNCRPGDKRCYELTVPESQLEYAMRRMVERDQ